MTVTVTSEILVVDDHPFFRQGLVEWLNVQQGLHCCAEADTGATTMAAIRAHNPDLVLLDLRLQAEDGLELIKQLVTKFPGLRVLIISQHAEVLYAERSLRAGALGYVMKDEHPDEVARAIRSVLKGEPYVGKNMSDRLMQHFVTDRRAPNDDIAAKLSDRELHIFELIGAGKRLSDIARELGRSVKTIESHRENIRAKLQIADSWALAEAARVWHERRGVPLTINTATGSPQSRQSHRRPPADSTVD